ncbi:MAG: GNAT family N-acetyltransferase [Pikeienuella sp.]
MSLNIRIATDADLPDWQVLFTKYLEFYEVASTEAHFENVWGWVSDPKNDFWCALAVDDAGKIAGFVHYQLWHASLSASMTCYMADLYVEPDQRGSGAGRLLIDHVIGFAKSRGLPSVDWLTADNNYAGRRLYDTYSEKTPFVLYSVEN